jgi:hypothetical protein
MPDCSLVIRAYYEAAQEIVKLLLDPPGLDGPIFVAPDGKALDW